jgi:YD repeat-containing protein
MRVNFFTKIILVVAVCTAVCIGSTSVAAADGGTISYTYDDLNRLVQVEYPDGTIITYTYDSVGNRTGYTVTVALDTFTLNYIAGSGGSLTGETFQTVNYGEDGTPVTTVPDTGYHFVDWSDGSTDNPRTDTNVTADVDVTANFALDTYTKDVANQDILVSGTLSGDYTNTHSNDSTPEQITEVQSSGKSNRSYLEHKWTIYVTGGGAVTFNIEAYHSPNNEGDDFEICYSTDDNTYTYMLTVDKTEDIDGYQTFVLPSNLSGTVYIRVTDMDQTRGNMSLDTIYIDHMFIESSSSPDTIPPADVGDLSTSTGNYGQVILTWTAPGDDSMDGTAIQYNIRYRPESDGPIDKTNWDFSNQVTDVPKPSPGGTVESMIVGNLEAGASYYFALKTADEVFNWSNISNVPRGIAGDTGTAQDFANQDILISGTVSGDYTHTHLSDDISQSITELRKSNMSYLEHKWTIDVTGGATVTFYVEAYRSSNSEGDDFTFAYSTDDQTYTDMLTVVKTIDDNIYQMFLLPDDLSGTVYIRVIDTDRTRGNKVSDTIYVDHMYIESKP